MPDVTPGREEEFRRLSGALAFSERLDRLIDAAEPPAPAGRPAPRPEDRPAPARVPPGAGLRAGFAVRLARLALALHREAAGAVVARETETSG